MRQFRSTEPPLHLDPCKPCGAVWFDPQEFETVPAGANESPEAVELCGRETLALERVRQIAERARAEDPSPDAITRVQPGRCHSPPGGEQRPVFFGWSAENDAPQAEGRARHGARTAPVHSDLATPMTLEFPNRWRLPPAAGLDGPRSADNLVGCTGFFDLQGNLLEARSLAA